MPFWCSHPAAGDLEGSGGVACRQMAQACDKLVSAARPNPAHTAIAAMESLGKKVTVVTQNIDALHQQAGSTTVLELHGDVPV